MNITTIVIPCRNEKSYIARCLDSLLKLNTPSEELEIFVCDGMSEDGTLEVLAEYCEAHPHIKVLPNPERTTPYALNLGAKAARGDVVIILGAHSEVDPDWVNACLQELEAHPEAGCVGGYVENAFTDDFSRVLSYATSSRFGVGGSHYRTKSKTGYVDTVLFGAYRKSVLEEIRYFDEELTRNQDDEINYRLIKAGHKIWLSDRIKCRYFVRSSFKKLFKQYFQYGYWKVYVNRKHGVVTTTYRQLAPVALVFCLLFGGLAAVLHPLGRTAFGAGVALYILMALGAAVSKTLHPVKILQLLLVFATLHLSYGFGYLDGLIQFVLLGRKPSIKHATLSR